MSSTGVALPETAAARAAAAAFAHHLAVAPGVETSTSENEKESINIKTEQTVANPTESIVDAPNYDPKSFIVYVFFFFGI